MIKLFEFYLCADFFELSLCSLSVLFGNAFFNCLGNSVNNCLSLCKAETCDLADCLDDLDLLSADFSKDNVKLGLLFGCGACLCNGACNCNSCCCAYAELFFYSVNKL